jgi:hypothetical protein
MMQRRYGVLCAMLEASRYSAIHQPGERGNDKARRKVANAFFARIPQFYRCVLNVQQNKADLHCSQRNPTRTKRKS